MTVEDWLKEKTGYCEALEATQRPEQCDINRKAGKRPCQECKGLDMAQRAQGTCDNCKRTTAVENSGKYGICICPACRAHFDKGGKGIPPRVANQIQSNKKAALALEVYQPEEESIICEEILDDLIYNAKSTGLDRLIRPSNCHVKLSEKLIHELRINDVTDQNIETFLWMGLNGQLEQVQP